MYRRIADLLKNASPGDAAEIRGWVRTRRDSKGGFSFVEVNDGSCFASLQAVVPADVPGYEQSIKDVTTGSSVAISGKLVDSPGKGQRLELQADALRLLGTADADAYP
nr:OB-fold nucleic acid binding domain-containing protein [Planctomycetota bacterium]